MSEFYRSRRAAAADTLGYAGFLIGFLASAFFARGRLTAGFEASEPGRAVFEFLSIILAVGVASGIAGMLVGAVGGWVWERVHRRRRDSRAAAGGGGDGSGSGAGNGEARDAASTGDARSPAPGGASDASADVSVHDPTAIRYDRDGFTAERFLALLQRVWPREHDESAAMAAVSATINIGAWDGEQLVGSVRVLTDGYFSTVVTEVLVDPDYRRRGIGRSLMNRALAASPRGMLFTGAPAQSTGFLERIGCERGPAGYTMRRPAATHSPARAILVALAVLLAPGATPLVPSAVHAQRPTLSSTVRQYVSVDTAVVALTNARVIDGTGAPARQNQTLVIRDGIIAAIGNTGSVAIPAGAQVMDLAGKSVIPGFVMVHEHLYYPTGGGVYANLAESFTRLYLAGGVTSMRTGGNMNGYGELAIARAIEAGQKPGPWIDATAPYLEGPGLGIGQLYALKDADDARRMVNGARLLRGHRLRGREAAGPLSGPGARSGIGRRALGGQRECPLAHRGTGAAQCCRDVDAHDIRDVRTWPAAATRAGCAHSRAAGAI